MFLREHSLSRLVYNTFIYALSSPNDLRLSGINPRNLWLVSQAIIIYTKTWESLVYKVEKSVKYRPPQNINIKGSNSGGLYTSLFTVVINRWWNMSFKFFSD